MSYLVTLNSDANTEFTAAYLWYEAQQAGLGDRFGQEIEKQLQKIKKDPLLYHFSKGNYREANVNHFPFTIVCVFNKEKNTIYISSIFHTSRNPKGKFRK